MNNNDFEVKKNRRTTATRRERHERKDVCCEEMKSDTSEGTTLEYTFEEVEMTEEEYLHLFGRKPFPVFDIPIGFECRDGQRIVVGARRVAHETVLEESDMRYVPIKEYEKNVDECGLTNLFGKRTDMKTITERLAKNVKALRKWIYKVSLTDLAFSSDVTRQYIAQIENGEKCPSLKALCQIADALGTNPAMLISLDMPNHYMHYADIFFHELSKKDKDKQEEIMKKAIEFVKNA